MKAKNRIHILVVEPSQIIRSGVVATLLEFDSLSIDIAQEADTASIASYIEFMKPDVVIVNPNYLAFNSPRKLVKNSSEISFVALQSSLLSEQQLVGYDATISMLDSASVIEETLAKVISADDQSNRVELSAREKEIVASIARGMSNKEMADKLFISTHTVMTHRRNIASKLKVHNPAGLTIYAIVNGLIDISEVK